MANMAARGGAPGFYSDSSALFRPPGFAHLFCHIELKLPQLYHKKYAIEQCENKEKNRQTNHKAISAHISTKCLFCNKGI